MAEKTRDKFIRILEQHSSDCSDRDVRCELIQEGYLDGTAVRAADGSFSGCAIVGATAKGRMLLLSLLAERDTDSLGTRVFEFLKWVAVFLIGLFASDFHDWLSHFISR